MLWRPAQCRRRDFLRTMAGALAFPAVRRFAPATETKIYPFAEVPPSASGITWTHTSGSSPEKYLPESTGAGCAFLDYDNDGWMDIYLVNSGPCDFYTPPHPLRNALYRNNRDGTFTDVTEKAGVAGGGYGMGAAVGDYNGDGFPDLYVTQYGRAFSTGIMVTAPSPTSRRRRASLPPDGPRAPSGLITTMTANSTSSCAASSISARRKTTGAELPTYPRWPV